MVSRNGRKVIASSKTSKDITVRVVSSPVAASSNILSLIQNAGAISQIRIPGRRCFDPYVCFQALNGYSTVLVNMKLVVLRAGDDVHETITIHISDPVCRRNRF